MDDNYVDEVFEDEDSPEPPPDTWKRIAYEGDNGRWWEDNCPIVEEASELLMRLGEVPSGKAALPELIRGLPLLHQLPAMRFPPLSRIEDFDLYFDDWPFLVLTTQRDSTFCPEYRLYIAADQPEQTEPLLAEFAELNRRLKAYPPLQQLLS